MHNPYEDLTPSEKKAQEPERFWVVEDPSSHSRKERRKAMRRLKKLEKKMAEGRGR